MEDKTSEKIVIVEEQLDGIDRDGTGNLEDLLKLVLINEDCWNPKVVVDGGEVARNINQKKSQTSESISPISESISPISISNIVN